MVGVHTHTYIISSKYFILFGLGLLALWQSVWTRFGIVFYCKPIHYPTLVHNQMRVPVSIQHARWRTEMVHKHTVLLYKGPDKLMRVVKKYTIKNH